MIKFFRHIRQKLLSENKFSKYLLYAAGEIILVVIGILIALQINAWNEGKKTKEKELKYLSLIKVEMASNLQSVQDEKVQLNAFLTSLGEMMELQANTDQTISNAGLSQILVPILSRDMDFNYKNGTLNEIIATGNLKDITNDSIRNILSSLGGDIERVRAQEYEVNKYIQKSNNFIEKHGNVKQVVIDVGVDSDFDIPKSPHETNNLFLLKSTEFENIMMYAMLTGTYLRADYYSKLELNIQSLIALIDDELKN